MPQTRVLTETDGPFGKVDGANLRPIDSWRAVDELAEIWGQRREQVVATLKENLGRLAKTRGGKSPEHRAPIVAV